MTDKRLAEIDDALANEDVKRAEVAIARLLRGQNTPQERAELLLRRAQARLQAARPDDALEDLQTSLAIRKDESPDSLILRGDIHFARFELAAVGFADRADTDTALECYQAAVRLASQHPRMAWIQYQMGRIYLSQNDIQQAQTCFETALRAPNNPPVTHALCYERLGFIASFEHRQPADALSYFQQAIKHYPPHHDKSWLIQLYIRVSGAYLELGEHQAALDAARRALRDVQDGTVSSRAGLPEAHMAIAAVLAAMPGSEEEAVEHYMRFLQSSRRPPGIDVTWSQVYETVGDLSFRLERYQQAINAYEKALEYNPYHPWEVNLRYQIARSFYRMRAYERAIEALERMQTTAAKDKVPITDWRVYNLSGNCYFALERYQEAVSAYRHALHLAPSSIGAEVLEKTRIYLRFSEELAGNAP